MRKYMIILFSFLAVAGMVASVSANDLTPRYLGLGGTSLAIYNFPGMEPVFENLATMCTAQDYSITLNANHAYNTRLGSNTSDGYTHRTKFRSQEMKIGLRAFLPFVNREEEMARRLGVLVEPRFGYGYVYQIERNTTDNAYGFEQPKQEKIYKPLTYGGRFGIAYGIADEFAFGLGLSTYGTRDRIDMQRTVYEDMDNYTKVNDEYYYLKPQLWVFEAGILIRPADFLQIGLNYVNGDQRKAEREVNTARETIGDEEDIAAIVPDYDNVRIPVYNYIPRRIGLGLAWKLEKVETMQLLWDVEYVQKVEIDDLETYNAMNLSFGVENRWDFFTLRGGVATEVGMGSDSRRTFSPNAGVGFTIFKHMIADLGVNYSYGWWNDDDNTGENYLQYGLSLGGTF